MTPRAPIDRRGLLRFSVLALAAGAAPARADTTDLVMTCDTTLAPAMRKVAAAYLARAGVRVHVFPTGPGLILPQLRRDIQNDVVVTQVATLDQAAQIGIVAPETTRGEWRNPLVIAGPRGASATDRTVAACDPSPASEIDGPRILELLGLRPARILGAVDTDEVAALVTSGTAQAGLLHMTDVRADPRLAVIHPVPEDIHAPIVYAAAVTRGARRPDPQGLVAFLATSGAMALLAESGLEVHA